MGVDRLLTVPSCLDRCNEPTTVTYQDAYYTATIAGQTITITNCPCTITTTSVRTMDCPSPPSLRSEFHLSLWKEEDKGREAKKKEIGQERRKGRLDEEIKDKTSKHLLTRDNPSNRRSPPPLASLPSPPMSPPVPTSRPLWAWALSAPRSLRSSN